MIRSSWIAGLALLMCVAAIAAGAAWIIGPQPVVAIAKGRRRGNEGGDVAVWQGHAANRLRHVRQAVGDRHLRHIQHQLMRQDQAHGPPAVAHLFQPLLYQVATAGLSALGVRRATDR